MLLKKKNPVLDMHEYLIPNFLFTFEFIWGIKGEMIHIEA